jgi:hypothetical protein
MEFKKLKTRVEVKAELKRENGAIEKFNQPVK